ncbi:MAG: hypothetical protein INR62_04270 [Rhodospirillales bacterium]|nr:hypothetical protein [Acetobacter sp.]
MTSFLSTLRRRADHGRGLRKDTYGAIVGSGALACERFLSASIRQKLYRQRPENIEISAHVDEDLGAGWLALEELRQRLHADQLICSDKIVALVSESDKYFWSTESMFRAYGHSSIDIDDLLAHAQGLLAKLKRRCRSEIGLGWRR